LILSNRGIAKDTVEGRLLYKLCSAPSHRGAQFVTFLRESESAAGFHQQFKEEVWQA